MRLAILASHPIQYQAPLFRELARRVDLVVFFAHRASATDQADAGYGVRFEWDVDLLAGYEHDFLPNVSTRPSLNHFGGCDTPAVGARLRAGRFDHLLVMGWHLKSFVQAIGAAKRLGLPVMVRGDSQLHTPRRAVKRLVKRLIYPSLLRAFDIALYVGARSRAYWEHYRFPAERLVFSPHCVDNAWFAERATPTARSEFRARHGIAEHERVALFAGRLVAMKRPFDLVAAAGALRPELPLTIMVAGAGPLAESLAAAAAAQSVRLVHLGFRNQSEMPAAYAASDLLVLPSDGAETWGLVANEALACGRPVVVSDACGCSPDLAADGVAGRAYPVGDVARLAAAMAEIVQAPPARAAIAAKSAAYGLDAAASGIEHGMQALSRRAGVAA